MSGFWQNIRGSIHPPGKDQLLILILLGLLLAVIAIPTEKKGAAGQQEEQSEAEQETEYESRLEQRLEELLSQVEGIGSVRVMITFEETQESTTYLKTETCPKVEGVLVVARGGSDSRIKQEILEAAEALFGIDAHKIKIMKMEESK